ncbi:MAG: hypothetical protein PHV46_07725 [Bacteroidales bacterium]|nr:hypothetical protein [Bacteroidales bacterium]
MKALSTLFVKKSVLITCLVVYVAVVVTGCTKAPEPVSKNRTLTSTTMLPMSGNGDYAEQIIIWKNYTTSFYDFSILHNTLGSILRQNVGISFMENLVETKFMNAYYSLIALDDLFVDGIYQLANGTPSPPALLDQIQLVDFSIQGGAINTKYVDSWSKFKPQIYAIVRKANTETETGKELKAAAEDFITRVDSCISLMYQIL